MSFSGLFYTASLSVSLAFLAQAPEPKEMPDNKGSIEGENVYHNPTLNMTITLPGSWHFFDRTMYLTAEEKQKKKEDTKRVYLLVKGRSADTGKSMSHYNHQRRHLGYTRSTYPPISCHPSIRIANAIR